MAKYKIPVQLTGTNGNALALVGKVAKALRTAGVGQDEINQFNNEALSGDYGHVLTTCMDWVEVS